MSNEARSKRVSSGRNCWRTAAWVAISLGAFAACASSAEGVGGSEAGGTSSGLGGDRVGSSASTSGGSQAGGKSGAGTGTDGSGGSGGSKGKGGGADGAAGDKPAEASGGSKIGGGGKGTGGTAGRGGGRNTPGSGGAGSRGEGGKVAPADGGAGSQGEAGRGALGDAGVGGKGEGGRNAAGAGGGTGGRVDGGSAGGGAGGDGADYKPCPTNGDPCKILPLGDSITVGLQSSAGGGYRVELFTKAVQANQNITFVGTQTPNGPATVAGKTFPKDHEGISGQRIQEIQGRVANAATKTKPHIVLVMAGTNDLYSPLGSGTMTDRLGLLLDEVIKDLPDALVVVSTLTPLSIGNYESAIKSYNASIPGLVQTRAGKGKHVTSVDFGTVTTAMLGDGVHPNDQGYKIMGDIWYDAIKDVLPAQ